VDSSERILEALLSDLEWRAANDPDPLAVLGACINNLVANWELLDEDKRRLVLDRAHRNFEMSTAGIKLKVPEDEKVPA
jgi:hypothetical protein